MFSIKKSIITINNKDIIIELMKYFQEVFCYDINRSPLCINKHWFVDSWNIEILQCPKKDEEITIETESCCITLVKDKRKFWVKSNDETLLIRAWSDWYCCDIHKKTIERIPYYHNCEEHSLHQKTNLQLINPKQQYITINEVLVDKKMIDENNHLNNVFYLEMAFNSIDQIQIKKLVVDYKKEVLLGETIAIKQTITDNLRQIIFVDHTDEIRAILSIEC